jgi:hypothetical protein
MQELIIHKNACRSMKPFIRVYHIITSQWQHCKIIMNCVTDDIFFSKLMKGNGLADDHPSILTVLTRLVITINYNDSITIQTIR